MTKIFITICLILCLNSFQLFAQGIKQVNNPNKDSVLYYLNKSNIRFKKFVLKQILYESNFLKSKLSRLNNNIIGFRKARARKTYAISSKYGYAVYKSLEDCILDYELFQNKFKGNSLKEYEIFVNKIYSQNKKTYSKKINSINIDRFYKNLIITN
jgi:uncharacterized FlgJ-related protein